MDMPHLHVQLLGVFRVRVDGQPIASPAWRLRTAGLLVKALALAPDFRLHREQIMDILWPDTEPDTAAANLRYTLHTARRAFASSGVGIDGLLVRERELLLLGPAELVQTDVALFESVVADAWRTGDLAQFRHATALYGGDLLPEERYDDWIEERRTTLRTSYLALLSRLAALEESTGDSGASIATLQRVLTLEPLDESAHTSLMRVFARAGDRQRAIAQYQRLCTMLDEELATEPDLPVRELADAIEAGHFPATPAASPDTPVDSAILPGAAPASSNNLPNPLTQLIGRDQELAEVRQFLATHRLVTLTGPGGVGKTRLAVEIGCESLEAFPDGVWMMSLASLRETDLVLPSIVWVLGLEESVGTSPVDALAAWLAGRRLLLILDNMEHLLDAAPQVAELLWRCPVLRVLTTSRVRLRLRGEQIYPVPPLDLPPKDEPDPSEIAEFATVRLFAERAREVDPFFRLTHEIAPTVAAICRRLDGLPLAIELAAARVDEYSLDRLIILMERRLPVLTDGPRDLPNRQQTLWNTIAWSYDLLTKDEQQLFRCLAVFAGGWTPDASVAVAGSGLDVYGGMERLIEHSLVRRTEQDDGNVRYAMLETIREFGIEQLNDAGAAAETHARHAQFFLDLATSSTSHLTGIRQTEWVGRLEVEQDNLRAALSTSLASAHVERSLTFVVALWHFWDVKLRFIEARRWLERALEQSQNIVSVDRARTLKSLAMTCVSMGQYPQATEVAEELLLLSRRLDDPEVTANALFSLGVLAAHNRDFTTSSAYYAECLRIRKQLNDLHGVISVLGNLGLDAFFEGDYRRAEALMTEQVRMARDNAVDSMVVQSLANFALPLGAQGKWDEARSLYAEALTRSHRIGQLSVVAKCLAGIAALAASTGQVESASRLFAASQHLRDELEYRLPPPDLTLLEHHIEAARARCDETTWTFAWQAGLAMSLDDAIALALHDAGQPVSMHGTRQSGRPT